MQMQIIFREPPNQAAYWIVISGNPSRMKLKADILVV